MKAFWTPYFRQTFSEVVKTAPYILPAARKFFRRAQAGDKVLFVGSNLYGIGLITMLILIEEQSVEGIVASIWFLSMIAVLNLYCVRDEAATLRHLSENPRLEHEDYMEANKSEFAKKVYRAQNIPSCVVSQYKVHHFPNIAVRESLSRMAKEVRSSSYYCILEDESNL